MKTSGQGPVEISHLTVYQSANSIISLNMIKNIIRRPAVCSKSIFRNRRNLSLVPVHSTFPATLYRLQFRRESQLYDQKEQQEDSEIEDAVNVSKDGLVYPEVSESGTSALPFTSVLSTNMITSRERSALYAQYILHARNDANVIGLLL